MGALGDYLPLLLRGAVVTVQISVLSYLLALALGLLGALVRVRKGGIAAKAIVLIYTTLVRGIPDIVLILLVYAGGQLLANAIARLAGGDVARFVAASIYLRGLGLSAPDIFAADPASGFALIEDLGDTLYADVLTDGRGEERVL